MSKIEEEKLEKICGGESLSGTVVSALCGIVRVLYDVGVSFGSSIRRIVDNNLCPLK